MTMITDRTRDSSFTDNRRTSPRHSLWAMAGDIATTLLDWHERACRRRQLLGLDDRALQDFGCSRADAAAEGGKPFWRP